MLRHFAALFLVVAWLATPWPAAARSDTEWHQVPEEEFYVKFRPPGVELGKREFHKGRSRTSVRYMGRWVGESGRFPRALMEVIRARFSSRFTVGTVRGAEYQINRLFKERVRSLGVEENSRNALGDIEYQRFTLVDANCVMFVQKWHDALKNLFIGYYCVDTAEDLPEKTILKMLTEITTREQ